MLKHKRLYGMKELAEILDISKQNLYHRMRLGSTFYGTEIPDPVYEISAGKIWTHEQLLEKINSSSPHSDWGRSKERLVNFTK